MSRAVPPPLCVAAAQLEFWTNRSWDDGVQVDQASGLDRLRVRTRNSVYDIIVGASGDVLVRGGRFFPEFTRAVVLGSSLGGAFLKVGGIYRGFSMEILSEGTRIVTSPVAAVARTAPDKAVH